MIIVILITSTQTYTHRHSQPTHPALLGSRHRTFPPPPPTSVHVEVLAPNIHLPRQPDNNRLPLPNHAGSVHLPVVDVGPEDGVRPGEGCHWLFRRNLGSFAGEKVCDVLLSAVVERLTTLENL